MVRRRHVRRFGGFAALLAITAGCLVAVIIGQDGGGTSPDVSHLESGPITPKS